jgi:hypothetical protein
MDRWHSFEAALSSSTRSYPLQHLQSFVDAAMEYIQATRRDQMVRRDVANALNALTEDLKLERKRVPGRVLADADRLECLFFAGFDPYFEGDEPPGL